MKKFIVFILSITIYLGLNNHLPAMIHTNYEKIADEITTKTAQELKNEFQLSLTGTGGSMMDDVKMMAMSFRVFQEIDMNEARKLIIKCTQKYLDNINSSEELKPYLHNYPFEPKNIEITIFLSKPGYQKIPTGKLDDVSTSKGKVEYYTHNDERQIVPIKKETFEEAIKLVNEQK